MAAALIYADEDRQTDGPDKLNKRFFAIYVNASNYECNKIIFAKMEVATS